MHPCPDDKKRPLLSSGPHLAARLTEIAACCSVSYPPTRLAASPPTLASQDTRLHPGYHTTIEVYASVSMYVRMYVCMYTYVCQCMYVSVCMQSLSVLRPCMPTTMQTHAESASCLSQERDDASHKDKDRKTKTSTQQPREESGLSRFVSFFRLSLALPLRLCCVDTVYTDVSTERYGRVRDPRT